MHRTFKSVKPRGSDEVYESGENSLFKLQKKLNYTPSFMCPFTSSSIIGSFSGHLLPKTA